MGHVVVWGRLLVLGIFLVSLAGKVRSRQAFREFVAATGTLLAVRPGRARWLGLLAVVAEVAIVVLVAYRSPHPWGSPWRWSRSVGSVTRWSVP